MVIEGWGAWDALQHDDYHRDDRWLQRGPRYLPASARHSRLFCSLGVGAALDTFTLLATMVVEGGLPGRLRRRWHSAYARDNRRIISSFAATAALGALLRASFNGSTYRSLSWTATRSACTQRWMRGQLAVEADASREDVLKRVGIERAWGLIAAVGTDAENVYAVLTARVLRPDLFIVGRAESEDATIS